MPAADDAIIQVADRLEPRVRKAFLDAVATAGSAITLKDLAEAVQSGDMSKIIALLNGAFAGALQGVGLTAGVASLRDAVQATFAAAAQAAIKDLPARVSTSLSFNLIDQRAVDWLNRYTFDQVQQITADMRQTIQQTVLRAFREGGHPYEQARTIRGAIGLTARQEMAVANYRRALEEGRLSETLERALRDGRYDRGVLSAIRNGRTLDQERIDRMVQRYRERYLQYRAQTIARTESIRAANQGRMESWRQAREQGLIGDDAQREWIVSGDERTCAVCNDLDGETRGLDEEFAPGIMQPPDPHPDCRCSLALVFNRAARAA